jgi:hypothetical protein
MNSGLAGPLGFKQPLTGSIKESMDNASTIENRLVRTPEVMVSYSSRDRARVTQFVHALRQSGVALWIDHSGIDGAQRWSEEIVNAIEASRVVLLFISRASMESVNIPKEVALAWESGKEFLPVALEEAKIPKSMQYQLAGIQYVKLYEGDPDAKFEAVLRALVRKGVRVSPYSMAVVSAGIGDRDQALEWLGKACDEHSGGLSRLRTEPRFNFLRSDPRFVELAKRAEAIPADSEEATAEIVLPQPLTPAQRSVPTGPVPVWKRLLWPEVLDAKSAREATAMGVWASLAIIVASWLVSFLISTPTMTGLGWWNDPILLTVIFGAIGFGVQKMGRPAAIIGAVLCALGLLGNLQLVQTMRGIMAMQEMYNNAARQPQLSGIYYSAWFGLLAGIVFVVAFVNAVRGTLAYRQMVQERQAQDKQNALSPQDLLAVRRRVMGLVQRVWGSGPLAGLNTKIASGSAPRIAVVSPAAAPVQLRSSPTDERPIVLRPRATESATVVGESRPVFAMSASVPAETIATPSTSERKIEIVDQFPGFDDAPDVSTLCDLVGAEPFRPARALAFLAANISVGIIFMLERSVVLGSLHPVYWQFALLRGVAVTLATVLAFRFIRSGWTAALTTAAVTAVIMLPICNTLSTFNYSDLFYREQFQEFLLIPFVDVLVTLLGLFFLVPRVRPLALGLWVGAVCAEIATSMLITTLRELGAGSAPDPVIAGTLILFVGVRSLVFAAVFWGGLKVTGIGHKAK